MEDLIQLAYAVDTFYFLVMGALVMFMAPGFAMLEAGMVRAKNTSEILTKNVALFSIACVMYLLIGYQIMYDPAGTMLIGAENTVSEVLESGRRSLLLRTIGFFLPSGFRGYRHVDHLRCRS